MIYKNGENRSFIGQKIQHLNITFSNSIAECMVHGSGYKDKNLDDFRDKVEEGIENMISEDSRV